MFNFGRFFRSFNYAIKGLVTALRGEQNLKIHLAAGVLVMALAYFLCVSAFEWTILLLCIALVISLEMVNTALEKLANEISTENRPGIGATKDIMAGAVLIASLFAAVIALLIFIPYLWK